MVLSGVRLDQPPFLFIFGLKTLFFRERTTNNAIAMPSYRAAVFLTSSFLETT